MANCYRTKEHERFRKEQLKLGDDGEWKLEEERKQNYKDYELKYVTYSSSLKTDSNFVYNHCKLSVYRRKQLIYASDDIYEDYPTFFYFYTLDGYDYLMFRKDDLYGYTIVNLTTMQEHNYFPDVVLNREQESFIIVEATLWNDILLLFGCHWACPYIYYALDARTYKTHMLCTRDVDETKTAIDDTSLTIYYTDGNKPKSQSYTYTEIVKILNENETYDI